VTEKAAKRWGLKVLQPGIEVTIRGFNDYKTYRSKTVELNLSIDGNIKTISALTVPNIYCSKIEQADLIKQCFESKGYQLADRDFNKTRDTDILIGTDNLHIFPYSIGLFGETACFLNTCLGVVPVGRTAEMVNQLEELSVHEADDL
jgi:hypothetical protein